MHNYKTEGIVLRRTNYGEADRILTIFTKKYGKIKILAKGVRRITSRRGPNIELFNLVTLFIHKGKNFDILIEAEVKETFAGWRKDLRRVTQAFYLCELVDGLCPERQENRQVFNLLIQTFWNLITVSSQSLPPLLADFELKLLQELGYWPKDKEPLLDLGKFIEGILQRKLKTPKFLEKLNT